jgi:2EXR family
MSATVSPSVGFPSLPAELRLKIWNLLLQPRVVQIYTRDGQFSQPTIDVHSGRVISDFKWVPYCDNPVVLSICQESRAEALRVYTVRISLPDSPGTIFIDPILDTVYFLSSRWSQHLVSFLEDWCGSKAGPRCIQSIAADSSFFLHNESSIFRAKKVFDGQGFKVLTMVIEEDDSAFDESSNSYHSGDHNFPDGDNLAEVQFAPPCTAAELRCWEAYRDHAETAFAQVQKRHPRWNVHMPYLRVVMARRGAKARGLDPDFCNMQGPLRHDPSWDWE